jgi:hypothetical protein
MSVSLLFAILAIICFVLTAIGEDRGKGIPLGLLFLTIMLAFG